MHTLVIATTNPGKLAEFQLFLQPYPFQLLSLMDFPNLDTDKLETANTLEENAILKAKHIAQITGLPAIADDTGLFVDVLNGQPGVFSKRFGVSDSQRNQKLLQLLKPYPESQRTAQFITVMALYLPGINHLQTVSGAVSGYIAAQSLGKQGFGFDPIFFSPELGKTFGQATPTEKSSVSHRSRALAKMAKVLSKLQPKL